jgi:3-oxosteroid 1-dehydrogenase
MDNPTKTVDLLVIGAGAAGMTTALIAKLEGAEVLLCEKAFALGGTMATSGGTIWVPGTSHSERDGVPDKVEDARAFLQSVVGNRGGDHLREAFLVSGRAALDDLESRSDVKLVAAKAHPDYVGGHPGEAYGGRALSPLEFDGRLLGADFKRLAPPNAEFMGLGGMMVTRLEVSALLKPFASISNFKTTLKMVLRYGADRLRYNRGTRLVMGNALAARLFYSLRKNNVPILFETRLVELMGDQNGVTGAIVEGPQGRQTILARKGVVLATGGIANNKALRRKFFPAAAQDLSMVPATNTGDGAEAAGKLGAAMDDGHDSAALWMPTSTLRRKNGYLARWPHILLDRAKPGLFAVNAAGKRFVNESDSYHDFVMGMLRSGSVPAHLVCDHKFITTYGLGLVFPTGRGLARLIRQGYVTKGETLDDLAAKIGVDANGLMQTVADYNAFAKTGVDKEFGRGTSAMNRFNGDASVGPNPCLGQIGPGPYYAVQVQPADLASSAGLVCDENARVLDEKGKSIAGLYAVGNDMASIFRGTYPGPGTTLGPALVFGWRLAKFVTGSHSNAL